MKLLRRTRSVLRKFNENQAYWHDAKIFQHRDGGALLITYWKNPELDGIWELHYKIIAKCMGELKKYPSLIQLEQGGDGKTYVLSPEGKRRLGT
ncbi:MAG: hypothetical protein RLZZ342_19 [Candidatus Parcubacteria bacterium]|jgi:hypothetical protein